MLPFLIPSTRIKVTPTIFLSKFTADFSKSFIYNDYLSGGFYEI